MDHINILFNQMLGLKTELRHTFNRLHKKLFPEHECYDDFSVYRLRCLIESQDEYQEIGKMLDSIKKQLKDALMKKGFDSYMIECILDAEPLGLYINIKDLA